MLSKGMGLVNRSVKNDEEIVSERCIFSKLEGGPRSAVLPPAVVHGLPLPNEHVHVVVRVHFLEAVVDLDECFLLGAASALVDLGLDLLEELMFLMLLGPMLRSRVYILYFSSSLDLPVKTEASSLMMMRVLSPIKGSKCSLIFTISA